VERWRVAIAIVLALAALPLLAIDNVSSADPERVGAAALDDPSIDLLTARATAWADAHESERQEGLDEATSVAQQIKAAESARLVESAIDAKNEVEAEQQRQAQAAAAAAAAAEAAARREAERAAAARKKPPPAPATTATPRAGEPTAEQWAKLRQCEASGRYDAVSSGGRFRGAYQFDQATWDRVAATAYPHLVGVDPATASPGDQDAVALTLYRARGASPWPRCGAALR
jgi:hypothetical protein